MGFSSDVYFCNTLIEMYGWCGCIDFAHRVFDKMPQRVTASWTSMISCYVQNEKLNDSFVLFYGLRMEGIDPNLVTIVIMVQVVENASQFYLVSIRYLLLWS